MTHSCWDSREAGEVISQDDVSVEVELVCQVCGLIVGVESWTRSVWTDPVPDVQARLDLSA